MVVVVYVLNGRLLARSVSTVWLLTVAGLYKFLLNVCCVGQSLSMRLCKVC